jgi:hypothetical protein
MRLGGRKLIHGGLNSLMRELNLTAQVVKSARFVVDSGSDTYRFRLARAAKL